MLIIKEVAASRGYTINKLAEALGVDRNTVSRTINGSPTVKTLEKIAEVLGVQVRDLFATDTKDGGTEIFRKKEDGSFESIGNLKI